MFEDSGGDGGGFDADVDRSSPSGAGGRGAADPGAPVTRDLKAVYAHERIEEVIRAIVEDALSPSLPDVLPWHDEVALRGRSPRRDPGDHRRQTDRLLAERLTRLLEGASPALVGRLASAPRFSDRA